MEPRGAKFIVGRDPGCDLVLRDVKVSRQHAAFALGSDGRLVVADLGSSNGTFVNGERLLRTQELHGGDRVRVGDTVLDVEETGLSAPPPPPPPPPAARAGGLRGLSRRFRGGGFLLAAVVVLVAAGAAVALIASSDGNGSEPRRGTGQAVETATRTSVLVTTDVDGRPTGTGSGWVLDEERGLVVTNAHVVNFQPPGRLTVDATVEGRRRRARVVSVAPCEDLAVLALDNRSGLAPVELGRQDALAAGETIVAGGFPEARPDARNVVTTQGSVVRVSGRGPDLGPQVAPLPNVISLDAPATRGLSGGPVVDLDGKLVGTMTLGGSEGGERRTYAIGVDRAKEVLPDLSEGRSLAWPGVAFDLLQRAGEPAGLLLTATLPGGRELARRLGGRPWLLEAVDERPAGEDLAGYCRIAGSKARGERATLTLREARRAARGRYRVPRGARRRAVGVTFQ